MSVRSVWLGRKKAADHTEMCLLSEGLPAFQAVIHQWQKFGNNICQNMEQQTLYLKTSAYLTET
jgi:hypothetical protein